MLSVRARLSIMMFLEYFVWGSWGVEIGGYMGNTLGFKGAQIGSVYSSTAIAAMISPLFMGYLADRWLSTEKLLAALHLIGAGVLYYASTATEFSVLFPVMIGYALLYMPTLALTNSISFENVKNAEQDFPLIRVFGTLGWIVAGWVVGFGLRAAAGTQVHDTLASIVGADSVLLKPNGFLLVAAGASAVLGLFCFALPYTPPKKSTAEVGQRKSILSLLGEPSFLVFVIASFLICIPLAFYYNLANLFLGQIDAPYPTALQTIGQISEVGFMALMPWFIARLGVKKMLAVGMLAWVARYVFFGSLGFPLIVVGLLLHGVCYDFFFVGSQIYVDGKADVSQRASAQSFIAFITFGLAMFVGAKVAGYTYDAYPPTITVAARDSKGEAIKTPLPVWRGETKSPEAASPTVTGVSPALGLAQDAPITIEKMEAQVGVYHDAATNADYAWDDLTKAAREADRDHDGKLTFVEWRAAQAHDWFHIWLWPAIAAGATLVFFWLGFRDKIVKTA